MLIGISGETALGQTVQIRAETDKKRINEMTVKEKEIRREWQEFKNSQLAKQQQKDGMKKVEEVQAMLMAMFGGK